MDIKFFKKQKSFKKRNLEINPDLYWGLIFFVGFLLSLAAFIFGFYLFNSINKEVVAEGNGEKVETVERERIEKILEYFSERKQKSTQILNSPAPVSDPSL